MENSFKNPVNSLFSRKCEKTINNIGKKGVTTGVLGAREEYKTKLFVTVLFLRGLSFQLLNKHHWRVKPFYIL